MDNVQIACRAVTWYIFWNKIWNKNLQCERGLRKLLVTWSVVVFRIESPGGSTCCQCRGSRAVASTQHATATVTPQPGRTPCRLIDTSCIECRGPQAVFQVPADGRWYTVFRFCLSVLWNEWMKYWNEERYLQLGLGTPSRSAQILSGISLQARGPFCCQTGSIKYQSTDSNIKWRCKFGATTRSCTR